eukprot:497518-Rhodomonas_salina.1
MEGAAEWKCEDEQTGRTEVALQGGSVDTKRKRARENAQEEGRAAGSMPAETHKRRAVLPA